jgi:hypothetical protein
MGDDTIALTLGRHEALVLFEWLATLDSRDVGPAQDSAEAKILWSIEGQLEKLLVEPLAPNYRELLDAARKKVLLGR